MLRCSASDVSCVSKSRTTGENWSGFFSKEPELLLVRTRTMATFCKSRSLVRIVATCRVFLLCTQEQHTSNAGKTCSRGPAERTRLIPTAHMKACAGSCFGLSAGHTCQQPTLCARALALVFFPPLLLEHRGPSAYFLAPFLRFSSGAHV